MLRGAKVDYSHCLALGLPTSFTPQNVTPFSMHWLLMFIFNFHVIKMNQSCLYQLQMVLTGA